MVSQPLVSGGDAGGAAIRLEGVTKHFTRGEGAPGVGPVTMEVAARSTLALVGASGSGKSTLLRMVVGLVRPDSGRVLVAGQEMTARTAPALRLRIGYVIQESGLFPHLTARDNAAVMARHLRWPEGRVAARVAELAGFVRLPEALLGRLPSALSGGERQRVAIMRALFLDPDVLLFDEPLGALDALVRSQLQEDLRAVFRAVSKTVLFVTHDVAEAAFVADEIALLSDGRVVERGASDEVVRHPATELLSRLLAAHRRLPDQEPRA